MHSLSDCTSKQCLQEGLRLRVSYFPFPFYITSAEDDETGKTEMTGVIPQHILPFVFESLNISYEFVLSDEFSHEVPVLNGTWPGEMGLLQKKVADVCVGAQYVDYVHAFYFCPLESYQRLTVRFLASYGNQEIFDFFTFLYQIENTIWAFVLLAFVFITILSSTSDSMIKGQFRKGTYLRNLWKTTWVYLASVFCEGSPRTMSSRLGQLLQFLWLFAVLVLVNVLYSQFKGILMVKRGSDFLHSVEDIAKSPKILPLVGQNTILEFILRDSPLEAYRAVYKKALSEKEQCFIDVSQLFDVDTYQLVKDGTHVVLAATSLLKYVLKDICHSLAGSRKMYFIEEEVTYFDTAFFTNWDFPEYLREAINQRFLILKEGGFSELWFSNYYKAFDKCEASDNNEQDMLLELKHLHTAFILYCALLIFTMVIFSFELIFWMYNKGKK